MNGFVVRGGIRDRGIIEMPGVPTVRSSGVSAAGPTLDWLTAQVKQRLLARGRRDLASITATPDAPTRAKLNGGNGQFQFCRLAFDGLNHRLKRPDPFTAAENAVFESLDQALRDPGQAPAASGPAVVSVPVSAPARAGATPAQPTPPPGAPAPTTAASVPGAARGRATDPAARARDHRRADRASLIAGP